MYIKSYPHKDLVFASSVAIINWLLFIVGQTEGVSYAMEFKKIIHFLYIFKIAYREHSAATKLIKISKILQLYFN